MFNFSGSEIVFLLLLALIILGPEKLPEAIRKFAKTYGEFKKVTTGFQTELKQALDEPMREMRETAEMFKQAATFDVVNPMEEAATALKAVTDPGPAAQTPASTPAPSANAADATDATDATHAAAEAAAADVAGAAPPLATAATATAEVASDEGPVADVAVADVAVAEDDVHRPFESKVISGGPRTKSLEEVMAARQAERAAAEAAAAEAAAASESPAVESAADDEGTPSEGEPGSAAV